MACGCSELHEGDVIVYEGAATEHCYILDEGVAMSVKEGEALGLKPFTVGDMFGDVGIMKKDPSKTSIVAKARYEPPICNDATASSSSSSSSLLVPNRES